MESNSIEFRYRLTEIGKRFVDPAIYFEFEYGKNIIGYEPKILLSKKINDFTTVINLASEIEKKIDTKEEITNF